LFDSFFGPLDFPSPPFTSYISFKQPNGLFFSTFHRRLHLSSPTLSSNLLRRLLKSRTSEVSEVYAWFHRTRAGANEKRGQRTARYWILLLPSPVPKSHWQLGTRHLLVALGTSFPYSIINKGPYQRVNRPSSFVSRWLFFFLFDILHGTRHGGGTGSAASSSRDV